MGLVGLELGLVEVERCGVKGAPISMHYALCMNKNMTRMMNRGLCAL